MDETRGTIESTQEEMREQIDATRSALTDKLEALEGQVMDTMTSARETVEESVQSTGDSVEETIQIVKTSVRESVTAVKNSFDVKHQVRQHPWLMVGGAFLTGMAVGDFLKRRQGRSGSIPGHAVRDTDRPAENTVKTAVYHGNGTPPVPAASPTAPARAVREPHFFGRFQEEVDQVKAVALGWAMSLVRDSVKDTLPQFASQINSVMDSVTVKLGGSPMPPREA